VAAVLVIGLVLLITGSLFRVLQLGPARLLWRPMAMSTGTVLFLEGVLMFLYAKIGKFYHRDRMLNMIRWRGDELVLDVGTGRGLLMIGAAKRLSSGKAVGIDVWSAKDLSGNNMQSTLHNADAECVRNKVEVESQDATALKFPDNSFDVVLSNLCIHNIPRQADRDHACREIVRVLKPGGRALISDFKNTSRYAKIFRESGVEVVRHGANWFQTFPPLRVVDVKKPQGT
jgi:ubiquinone/menaquinone biosynthesis C-methylase UbiE